MKTTKRNVFLLFNIIVLLLLFNCASSPIRQVEKDHPAIDKEYSSLFICRVIIKTDTSDFITKELGLEHHPLVYLHPFDGIKGLQFEDKQLNIAQNLFRLDENDALNKNKGEKKGWDLSGKTYTFDRLYCAEAKPGSYQLQKIFLPMSSNVSFNAFMDHSIKIDPNQVSYLVIQMAVTKQGDGSYKYTYGFIIPKEEMSSDCDKIKTMYPKLFEKYTNGITPQIPSKHEHLVEIEL